MNPEKRRIPLALQAVFVASNRGQDVDVPPPGNVAIRVFQSIFRRPRRRQISRGVTINDYSDDTIGPTKPPASYQQCETSHWNGEIETPRSSRDVYVEFPSASSQESNATTIDCSIDSEDNLYISPKKYIAKPKIKSMVSIIMLKIVEFLYMNENLIN
jgi:hypothetical protein